MHADLNTLNGDFDYRIGLCHNFDADWVPPVVLRVTPIVSVQAATVHSTGVEANMRTIVVRDNDAVLLVSSKTTITLALENISRKFEPAVSMWASNGRPHPRFNDNFTPAVEVALVSIYRSHLGFTEDLPGAGPSPWRDAWLKRIGLDETIGSSFYEWGGA